jgi:putative ABC transport system permease protein
VILMLMQLGFQDTLFNTSVRLHKLLVTDLVFIHRDSHALRFVTSFSRQPLYQALGHREVASVAYVYMASVPWTNPVTHVVRPILVVGFDPDETVVDIPDLNAGKHLLKEPETVLYDARSRRELGPVGELFRQGRSVGTEIARQRVRVVGLFDFGPSFSSDGNAATSVDTFQRITGRNLEMIDIGLVRLAPGADIQAVKADLVREVPQDVLVLTKPEFIEKELTYWRVNSPIGFIFKFGVVMAFVVGAVIVYQILYADVADHLAEYATLKAVGYTDAYLAGVVLSEALILSLLGFVPGVLAAAQLYRFTRNSTNLAMVMATQRSVLVFVLTLLMCCLSGAMAVRKVQSADPADVF